MDRPAVLVTGKATEAPRHSALVAPQAVPLVLFYSFQILYETPDVTLPSQAPASLVFPSCTKGAMPGQAFLLYFADWLSIFLILSYLVTFHKPASLCVNCALWEIYVCAFKEQSVSFLPCRQTRKLFISISTSQLWSLREKVTPPRYTFPKIVFHCVYPLHATSSEASLLP